MRTENYARVFTCGSGTLGLESTYISSNKDRTTLHLSERTGTVLFWIWKYKTAFSSHSSSYSSSSIRCSRISDGKEHSKHNQPKDDQCIDSERAPPAPN